jgi:hypothetical protein
MPRPFRNSFFIHRAAVIAFAASAGLTAHARAQDSLANAAESLPDAMLPAGPGVPRDELPPPPAPATIAVPEASEPQAANTGAIHFSGGVDFTNAYVFRGYRLEDRGFIAQPYAGLAIDLHTSDAWWLQGTFSTWHSLHDRATAATATDDLMRRWYEADYVAGLTLGRGNWTFTGGYAWFASPNGGFTTVEELQLGVKYNDAEALGAWALAPAAVFALETGDGTSDGRDRGAYLQLSIEPGFNVETQAVGDIRFSFPAMVGISLKDYYQDSTGNDDALGFASVGAKASVAIPFDSRYGSWSAYVAGSYAFLGDTTAAVNSDEDTIFVVSGGVSFSY